MSSLTESRPLSDAGDSSQPRATTPGLREISATVAIALLAALFVLLRGTTNPEVSDFDQLWHGARAVMMGANPYEYVGPFGQFRWDNLYYPLPAVLLASPFTLLPLLAARACFAAVSAGLLSAGVLRYGPSRLVMFLSAPMLIALGRGQWSPLLVAAAFLPYLAWIGAAKPNIALPLLLASANIRTAVIAGAVGGCILLITSFLVDPGWFVTWREILTRKGDSVPMLPRVGGPLILLALLRWRRKEAWFLVALGCVPQTPSLYDVVPLFIIGRGLRDMSVLALGGNLAYLMVLSGIGLDPDVSQRVMLWSLICVWLPATLMILRRPNVTSEAPVATSITRLDLILLGVLLVSAFFALWGTLGPYV
jgi:hypothetical protein